MSYDRGARSAEYIRVTNAIKDLKELGLRLIEHDPQNSQLVDRALEYLDERKIKVSPRS